MTTAEFTRACMVACALLIGVWVVTFILSLIFRRNPYLGFRYRFGERVIGALLGALMALRATTPLIFGYIVLRALGLAG